MARPIWAPTRGFALPTFAILATARSDVREPEALGAIAYAGCRRGPLRRFGIGDGEQVPAAGDALELVAAAVLEADGGAEHQVADGRGDQHLAAACLGGDPCTDVHGHAAEIVAENLALPGVDARADLDAELFRRRRDDPLRGPDGSRGPVEAREHAVAE